MCDHSNEVNNLEVACFVTCQQGVVVLLVPIALQVIAKLCKG